MQTTTASSGGPRRNSSRQVGVVDEDRDLYPVGCVEFGEQPGYGGLHGGLTEVQLRGDVGRSESPDPHPGGAAERRFVGRSVRRVQLLRIRRGSPVEGHLGNQRSRSDLPGL